MKCEDVRDLFSEFYDGETEQASEIALHFDGCSVCKNEFDSYSRLLVEVTNLDEPDVPEGFHSALVSYADGFYRGRKRHISLTSHRFASVFGSLAAAAAAVLIVWFSGVFDTGAMAQPEMFAEFAMPHAAAAEADEAWLVYDDAPLARGFYFEDETYDLYMGYFDEPDPFAWHQIRYCEIRLEGFTGYVVANHDNLVFFGPLTDYVEQYESPIRPHVAAAILFTFVGIFLGFNIHIFVKYMERKSNNAP